MSETTGRGRARKAPAEKTRQQRLEADRDRLEELIEKASSSTLPNLVREHRMVLAELDRLAAPEKGSTRDQLAERRAARKSTARKASAARTPPA